MALSFCEKLVNYHRSGYPLMYVQSHEERRVIRDIQRAFSAEKGITIYEWDEQQGLRVQEGDSYRKVNNTVKPQELIEFLDQYKDPKSIFILKDFHFYLPASKVIRYFRNMVFTLKARRNMVIFLSPIITVPTELEKEVQLIDYSLPDEAALDERLEFIKNSVQETNKKKFNIEPQVRQDSVEAAKGLTFTEVENAYALAIATHHDFSPDFVQTVFGEKIQQVKKSGQLTYLPPDIGFDGVGGHDELKEWITVRAKSFSPEARKYGLPFPKGVLLCGCPGCGKSLLAKATSKEFNVPLFQLDIGSIFGSKVGETEANCRGVIKIIEGVGRCIVLID